MILKNPPIIWLLVVVDNKYIFFMKFASQQYWTFWNGTGYSIFSCKYIQKRIVGVLNIQSNDFPDWYAITL